MKKKIFFTTSLMTKELAKEWAKDYTIFYLELRRKSYSIWFEVPTNSNELHNFTISRYYEKFFTDPNEAKKVKSGSLHFGKMAEQLKSTLLNLLYV